MTIWEGIQYVGTPLTLVAFVVATAAWLFRRQITTTRRLIETAPPDDRAKLVRLALETYNITDDNLTREQKFGLLSKVIDQRALRFQMIAICSVVIAMITALTVIMVTLYTEEDTNSQSPDLVVDQLELQTVRPSWSRGVEKLAALILESQQPDGGFSYALANPGREPDPWTSAQCIAALLVTGHGLSNEVAIKTAFQWVNAQKQPDGWKGNAGEPTSTEVTAWVGIAYEMAFSHGLFTDDERNSTLSELRSIYQIISNRQGPNGTWLSFSGEHPKGIDPTLTRGGYATSMALTFLIKINKTRYDGHIADKERLSNLINRGLRWVLTEYNPEVNGWEERRSEGKSIGLSLLYLNLLTEAKLSGFKQIEPNRYYRAARAAWLQEWSQYARERKISENYSLTQKQHVSDVPEGTVVDIFTFPVRFQWYPWSLLLATYLASDADLSDNDELLARRVRNQLLLRVDEAVDRVTVGETFLAAETLLSLGYVGSSFD